MNAAMMDFYKRYNPPGGVDIIPQPKGTPAMPGTKGPAF
jgi:hypothetical protein